MMLGNVANDKDMVRVQVYRKKKIGTIVKIIPEVYEIPKQIVCSKDGDVMEFETWNDFYRCKNCNATVTATEYIKQQIEKANNNEIVLNK